jgi:hypothetical protein
MMRVLTHEHQSLHVMPALVAGIHVFLILSSKQDVDGRDKPGHDEWRVISLNRWLNVAAE